MARKSLLVGLVLVLVATFALNLNAPGVRAQDAPTERTITVTGNGTAYGAPNIVVIGLGVDVSNPDVRLALDASSERMNAILQALKDNGVAAEDIRTENFSIYQDYGYAPMEMGQQGQPSYRVSTSVTVTVRDTARVGDLLAAAVDAGANLVNYIQFDIDDRSALQAEARRLAVDDARARAEDLAALMGLAVGDPITVVEGVDYYGGPLARGMGGGGGVAEAAPPISQGQLSVNMTVTITYALVPAR